MSEIVPYRTIAAPLPPVPERLIQRRGPVSADLTGWHEPFDRAERIVDEAMAFSGINRETAPVRWEAARKAAAYAAYVALGIAQDAEFRQAAQLQAPQDDREWHHLLVQVDYIGRFESSMSQSRIGEE